MCCVVQNQCRETLQKATEVAWKERHTLKSGPDAHLPVSVGLVFPLASHVDGLPDCLCMCGFMCDDVCLGFSPTTTCILWWSRFQSFFTLLSLSLSIVNFSQWLGTIFKQGESILIHMLHVNCRYSSLDQKTICGGEQIPMFRNNRTRNAFVPSLFRKLCALRNSLTQFMRATDLKWGC